jgi:hypothetical protein
MKDQSITIVYVLIFPIFWGAAGIALALLLWLGKIKVRKWNIVTLIFSTPLPTWLFILIWTMAQ